MRDQTARTPSPTRPQQPGEPTHPTRTRPPPRPQHFRAIRALDPPGRQPRLDSILIGLYRKQRCLRASSTALPQRLPRPLRREGRSRLPSRHSPDPPHNDDADQKDQHQSGTSATVCTLSDGHQPPRRHPERRSTPRPFSAGEPGSASACLGSLAGISADGSCGAPACGWRGTTVGRRKPLSGGLDKVGFERGMRSRRGEP
jgi:hypothetical protein